MKRTLKALLKLMFFKLPVRLQTQFLWALNRKPLLVGRGTFVHRTVQILGREHVRLGDNTVLSEGCWLNINHRNAGELAIEIGSNTFIGRRNFFSSGKKIQVGSFVLTTNDCHFLGSSHIIDDPIRPVISTGTTADDTIRIGHNTFVGAGARLLGNVTVGHGCVVGAASLVINNVPPFSLVAGSPAKILKRYSFASKNWLPISEWSESDEKCIPEEEDYLQMLLQQQLPRMPYLAAGSDMGQC